MKRSMTLLLLLALTGCGESKTPEAANGSATQPSTSATPGATQTDVAEEPVYDDKTMEAAIAQAKSGVDIFIAELANPTGTDHEVKAPIQDGAETEHMWITGVTFENGEFKGKINAEPEFVKNVKAGQEWIVKKEDISDWTFLRDGKRHGEYTTRALIPTMSEKEAAEFAATLADP